MDTAHAQQNIVPGLSAATSQALANDPNAIALIKAYLAIPDETVRRKLRRLAEEIAAPLKRSARQSAE